jgi:hypothetical protein
LVITSLGTRQATVAGNLCEDVDSVISVNPKAPAHPAEIDIRGVRHKMPRTPAG